MIKRSFNVSLHQYFNVVAACGTSNSGSETDKNREQ